LNHKNTATKATKDPSLSTQSDAPVLTVQHFFEQNQNEGREFSSVAAKVWVVTKPEKFNAGKSISFASAKRSLRSIAGVSIWPNRDIVRVDLT
jgi:hypothetical protein